MNTVKIRDIEIGAGAPKIRYKKMVALAEADN